MPNLNVERIILRLKHWLRTQNSDILRMTKKEAGWYTHSLRMRESSIDTQRRMSYLYDYFEWLAAKGYYKLENPFPAGVPFDREMRDFWDLIEDFYGERKLGGRGMKLFIQSDAHYDFYVPDMSPKKYFEQYFLPADVLVCAGDIANTFDKCAEFIEEVSQQYNDIVLCLGNHDLVVTWDKGRFRTSEEKIDAIKELCSEKKNVHLLDGECVEIGGLKFGGAMGIWDYSFIEGSKTDLLEEKFSADWHWHNSWFDGQHWNYFWNDIEAIRKAEMEKLRCVLAQKPDVVLTHFCPQVSGIPPQYKNDFFSTYFYFDRTLANSYTKDGAIWCAGHTHTACREENLFVNPLGYPGEFPLKFNSLKREVFLLER